MDPREFNRLATALAQGNGPAHWRSATSRAYYAVFNVGAEMLRTIVPLGRGSKVHGQVQKLLANCNSLDVQAVGNDLNDMQSRRIDADYELGDLKAENQKTVQATVEEAREMIEKIDQVFSSATSRAIKKSIQQYWTGVLRESLGGHPPIV